MQLRSVFVVASMLLVLGCTKEKSETEGDGGTTGSGGVTGSGGAGSGSGGDPGTGTGTGTGPGSGGDPVKPAFDLAGAVALGVSVDTEGLTLLDGEAKRKLYALMSDGTVRAASQGVDVHVVHRLRDGVLVYGAVEGAAKSEMLVVEAGAEPVAFEPPSDYVMQNSQGDLIFKDISIRRKATGQIEKLTTTLSSPTVWDFSGNFVVISSGESRQVFDTVTSKRYNVSNCSGPDIVALSDARVFVHDCALSKQVMDMSTGARTATSSSAAFAFNNESIAVGDGAIGITQGCATHSGSDYRLCHIDPDGVVTDLLSATLDVPASGGAGGTQTVLFVDGDDIVIRELNAVVHVKRGVDQKNVILSGLNVTSVSLADGHVTYLAEDNLGNAVAGRYELATGTDTRFDSSVAFEQVVALKAADSGS